MSNRVAETPISSVAELVRGVTYKKEEASGAPQQGFVPLLRATNIDRSLIFTDFVFVPERLVKDEQFLRKGDSVIAASSGSAKVVGKAATLRDDWRGTFGAFCYVLRPDPTVVVSSYLAYYLQTTRYRTGVSQLAAGVNINNLRRQHFDELTLPLRPLPEQHRIVEAIESYLTRLDDAVATLERVQQNLKRYRASVLKAAVEGRLVPTEAELARQEGRDYEPASVLLERILEERRRRWIEDAAEKARAKAKEKARESGRRWTSKDNAKTLEQERAKAKEKYQEPDPPDTSDLPELPEGWCWSTLDQLTTLVRNGYSKAPRETEGTPILRISAVRPLEVDLQDVRFLPVLAGEYDDFLVEHGDLLFTRYNGSKALVGVCGLVRSLVRTLVYPDKLIRVVTVPRLVLAGFVELVANCGVCRAHVENHTKSTAGQHGVAGSSLKSMPVPLPPLMEQQRIRSEFERLLSFEADLESGTATNTRRCQRLRQSILKCAFEGKLVPQDPNDEPASVLLERIKTERTTMEVGKKNSRQHKSA